MIKKFTTTLCLSFILSISYAQVDYDKVAEVSTCYLIENVHIYQSNGLFLKNYSMLIRDGIIEQLGTTINKPYDAQEIKADTMYVYPAFIDGMSHAGIKDAEKKKDEAELKFPGDPPDHRAGITPYKSVIGTYNPSAKLFDEYRAAGFGAVHIVPKGKMMPGQGSVVLLNDNENRNPVLAADNSMFGQFKTTRGIYPSTVIGIFAKWRDLYRGTEYKSKHLSTYETTRKGLRPSFSRSEEALIPVVNKSQTVFFASEDHKDVSRALALKKELGFNLVLADVKQGWMAIDKIKQHNIPVLLSLDLPDSKKENEDKDEDATEEYLALNKKKQESIEKYIAQSSAFDIANINYGYSLLSSKAKDVHSNLMKIIEKGAKERNVINALTINTAKILGLDRQIGSIEKGKIANFFICDKPYFEKELNIKYTFVDGVKYSFDTKKKKSADDALGGDWSYELEIMGEIETGTLSITGNDEEGYDITATSHDDDMDEEMNAYEVNKSDKTLSFMLDVEMEDDVYAPVKIKLEFDAGTFSGIVSIPEMGDIPISGSKITKPE